MKARRFAKLLRRYRITDGRKFDLSQIDPADTAGLDEAKTAAALDHDIARLSELQATLYAERQWSLLCVFQAMDAGGKDGTIKHVMSGINPQGVQVTSFKAPGPEELDHDFLWRISRKLPERGRIAIFNRSHYEEVLVSRVHPERLPLQRIPSALLGRKLWRHRLEDIAAFEAYLGRQGIVILKFFLHISRTEQRTRFLSRLDTPGKNWKFDASDLAERAHWDEYMTAYQQAIAATATPDAPWYVVPADHKWFAHRVVAAAMIDALTGLNLCTPTLDRQQRVELEDARRRLREEI